MLRLGLRLGIASMVWAGGVFALHAVFGWTWLSLPFRPIAAVGTAVAFYLGLKNNAAYDRSWEARKIWGGIVNVSRSFASLVSTTVDTQGTVPSEAARELLHGHLAWVNALRLQLRPPEQAAIPGRGKDPEHVSQLRGDWAQEVDRFLPEAVRGVAGPRDNAATQILHRQSLGLMAAERAGQLSTLHRLSLNELLTTCHGLQGKCERIKNTPFLRHYSALGRLFTMVFVVLVPFGLLDEAPLGGSALELVEAGKLVVASTLVSWVFLSMEILGGLTEDPFEGGVNDVAMQALCRTIEIDVLRMLGDVPLPDKEQPVGGVLY